MALFTFIKRNPSPRGCLYVIDEAQNFAPSGAGTACKASTLSLVAQSRKYGLGMIFATQTPKGIDNKIVSNCTTHMYGRMNAPATIDAIHDLMVAKGAPRMTSASSPGASSIFRLRAHPARSKCERRYA
jgi:DNA helicase HerA-like ATPase